MKAVRKHLERFKQLKQYPSVSHRWLGDASVRCFFGEEIKPCFFIENLRISKLWFWGPFTSSSNTRQMPSVKEACVQPTCFIPLCVSNSPPELKSWRIHPFLFLAVPSLSSQFEENTAEEWAEPFLPPPCSCSCWAGVAVQVLVAAALKPWSLQKDAANTSSEPPLQAETAQGGIKDTWDNMWGIKRGCKGCQLGL